jgi:hypothetical protein
LLEASPGENLLPGKLALTRHPLVRLRGPLDPIFEFAASFRQLLGYHVGTARPRPIEDIGCEGNFLANSELVARH